MFRSHIDLDRDRKIDRHVVQRSTVKLLNKHKKKKASRKFIDQRDYQDQKNIEEKHSNFHRMDTFSKLQKERIRTQQYY